MTSQKASMLFLAAAILFALSLSDTLTGKPSEAITSGPTNIALISLSKVMNAHEGLQAEQEEIGLFIQEGEKELIRLQKEIESLNAELTVYAQDSKEFRDGRNEVERKKFNLQQSKDNKIAERDRMMAKAFKDAYVDIEQTVMKYAAQQGIQVVMSYGLSSDQVMSSRPEEIYNWISTVNTVWHDEQLDISDAIITIINGS